MPVSYKLSPQTLLWSGVYLGFISNTGSGDNGAAGAEVGLH